MSSRSWFCRQHSRIVINCKSPTSQCHQHDCSRYTLLMPYLRSYLCKIGSPGVRSQHLRVELSVELWYPCVFHNETTFHDVLTPFKGVLCRGSFKRWLIFTDTFRWLIWHNLSFLALNLPFSFGHLCFWWIRFPLQNFKFFNPWFSSFQVTFHDFHAFLLNWESFNLI